LAYDTDQTDFDSGGASEAISSNFWKKGRGFSFFTVFRLLKAVRAAGADRTGVVLHAHDLGPLLYGAAVKFFLPGRVRLVVTVHTVLHWQRSAKYRFYFRRLLPRADQVVAVSPEVAALIAPACSKPPQVILNGVTFPNQANSPFPEEAKLQLRRGLMGSSAAVSALPDSALKKLWILSLARIHPGKGQSEILKIWNKLTIESRKHVCLFFVGPETAKGHQGLLEAQAKGVADRQSICFVGPSIRPELWIEASDIFISASLSEGMPLAPLEAAGAGLAVLLSQIEGHAMLAAHSLQFKADRPDEGAKQLEATIDLLLSQGPGYIRRQNWDNAQDLRRDFGVDSMAEKYHRLFSGLS